MSIRKAKKIFSTKSTIEGAGVHLHRVFGYHELPQFDPFLMLDDFSSSEPDKYIAGFPWHPHRGIETVTYMIRGSVRHEDSLGNKGIISDNSIQWMTAGSGIIHQEMPEVSEDRMIGFQLWVNLPKSHKMMEPRYQEISSAQMQSVENNHAHVKVIAGSYEQVTGPVADLMVNPTYLDVTIKPNKTFSLKTDNSHTAFFYIFKGSVHVGDDAKIIHSNEVVLLDEGDMIELHAGTEGARLLYIAGKPLNEPIAWYGPIVMNTEEELKVAVDELNNGTFVNKQKQVRPI